jgi:hypothetical protein
VKIAKQQKTQTRRELITKKNSENNEKIACKQIHEIRERVCEAFRLTIKAVL